MRCLFLILGLLVPTVALPQVSSLVVTEFMASNADTLADGNGDHSDWIEIHNPTAAAIDLDGLYLTDNADNLTKWQFPAVANPTIAAGGYYVVIASGNAADVEVYVDGAGYLHTTFKLSSDGEDCLLVDSDGTTVISGFVGYPEQGADISYGIGSGGNTGFFGTPTPDAANGVAGNGFVADTKFDIRRGFFTEPFEVQITCSTPGSTIKYTLDASSPSETNGTEYTGPVQITGTTTLRAMACLDGWFSTDIDTQTYIFIDEIVDQASTAPTSDWPAPTSASTTPRPPGPGGGSQAIDYEMDPDITGSLLYGDEVDDALRSIPTIIVTTDLPNLFDSTTGIYVNPDGEGEEWERPAAVEMVLADGTDAFHANGGLRIRGGVSTSTSNPKHSFRMIMRSEYGDSKIEYPMFGDEGADEFDKIDFRTAQNFSWNFSRAQYATWLDDPFSRDTMRDMGHPYARGFFFHLYLDGVYWGLYQTEERPDSFFCTSYMDGEEEDWDVLKADSGTGQIYAVDGNTDFYFAFWSQVNSGVGTVARYMRLKGQNADGTENAAYPKYLDEANLIDYMLIVFFAGATDMPLGPPDQNTKPRNLYAAVNREDPDGVKWMPHDNEHSLQQESGVNVNRVSVTLASQLSLQVNFNPWWLHTKLKTNAEYRMAFADRVHRHFFNGGPLTPEACTARYRARMNEIEAAMIAESARWGDYLTPASPRTRNVDWRDATDWVVDDFFNASPLTRTEIVLGQLKSAGLYPTVDAPEFNQHGGTVNAGFGAILTATAGTIYCTIDGSDPRKPGGSINVDATSGASGLSVAITSTTTVKARAYSGGTWSALTEATFMVANNGTGLEGWMLR
ncbi:CotH kinase family protein [bacterium]|nr:CotH kinase family protein [bacterium]